MSGKQKAAAPRKPAATAKFTPASAVPFVKRFQQAMIDAGGELPKYGVDGLFGPETEAAARRVRVEELHRRAAIERLQAEKRSQRDYISRLNEIGGDLRADNISLQIELREAKDRLSSGAWRSMLLAAGVVGLGAACMWVAMALGLV